MNAWESSQTIYGGGDCDDTSNGGGIVQWCSGELSRGWFVRSPSNEIDDDGDCYVECSGFDANIWEGGINTCELCQNSRNRCCWRVCNDSFARAYPRHQILNCRLTLPTTMEMATQIEIGRFAPSKC